MTIATRVRPTVDITQLLDLGAARVLVTARALAARSGAPKVDVSHVATALSQGDHERALPPDGPSLPLTEPARALFHRAYAAARSSRSPCITAHHLARALPASAAPPSRQAVPTPMLDRYGKDLTAAVRAGRVGPFVGRHGEIAATLEILARRTKNNPVLVGDPGVGKTAVVEAIAARLAAGDVPRSLRGKRLVSLDIAALLGGTALRGEFEQRLTAIVDEVTAAGRSIVLFVDEVHTLVSAGRADGAIAAGDLLKPALARGDLQLIGATTPLEFRRYVEADAAFARRLHVVAVPPASLADTVDVLLATRGALCAHHDVSVTDEAVHVAARLAQRYLTHRSLPDSALDLLDVACARTQLGAVEARSDAGARPTVTPAVVRDVAESITGVPAVLADASSSERTRLKALPVVLSRRVIGQPAAVGKVADVVQRACLGLGDQQRPTAALLLLGPPGVGKTTLARALSEALNGSGDAGAADDAALLRLDMSEFKERHAVARLIGSPPGYVGFGDGGELTEGVRRRPRSVVLLDEIDKAHPEVVDLLLQVLDYGRLTDSSGRHVDFRSALIVLTSNVAAEAVATTFRPELLDRLDDIVTFTPLDGQARISIADHALSALKHRLAGLGIDLRVDAAALRLLAEADGAQVSARRVQGNVRRHVATAVTAVLLDDTVGEGSVVTVGAAADGVTVTISTDAHAMGAI